MRSVSGKSTKRVIAALLALLMVFVCTPFSFADSYDDKLKALKSERDAMQGDIKDTQSQLEQGKQKVKQLESEIKTLDNRIYQTEVEINELVLQINDTKTQITEALDRLNKKQAELDAQNDALNMRLRSMYKNGDIGLLSVLLGSGTLTDLMTNMDMVQRIYDYDAKLLASLEDQYEVINQEKQDLLDLKAQLLELQDEAEKKKASLEADQIAAAQKREQVQQSNKDLEAQIDAMKKEADALSAQIKLLQSSRAYVGGKMLWPSQSSTRVTSPFGNRLHPILKVYKLHTGIDIGAPNGTNILAANDGTVISAGYNNSYGYMVMLDHGGGIVTLYAHCSKLLVSKGDAVARGQVIALVGSTGMSTGPHLHFEVRINGVYKNPLEYVTP